MIPAESEDFSVASIYSRSILFDTYSLIVSIIFFLFEVIKKGTFIYKVPFHNLPKRINHLLF